MGVTVFSGDTNKALVIIVGGVLLVLWLISLFKFPQELIMVRSFFRWFTFLVGVVLLIIGLKMD